MLKGIFERSSGNGTFNMTPIVDIVFLLIIFFMLVCQFIVAENFEVDVPDEIKNAQSTQTTRDMITTVTVTQDNKGKIVYAVGSEILKFDLTEAVGEIIADAIDAQLNPVKKNSRIVRLRIDKNITYKYSQTAIAGVSQSCAEKMQLAVIKD